MTNNGNRPPRAGMGRPQGALNKTTAALKEAILMAAEMTGEDKAGKDGLVGYCTFLAKEEPRAFATLLGRVLPMQVAGDPDNPIEHKISDLRNLTDEELTAIIVAGSQGERSR